ncbi:MAG TPA: G1 family glutamic endopeptidase [Terriglobales bacterium]|nr:G1 family glutamic endopeptidase [Terriglobales bacterium]
MKTLNLNRLSNGQALTVTSPGNKIGLLTLIALLLSSFATPASAQETLIPSPESISGVTANSPLPFPFMASSGQARLDADNTANDPATSSNSIHQAGYAVTGTEFTNVLGSWVVPPYHCTQTPNTYSSFGVVMDGYPDTNKTFEGVGTASNCVGTNHQYYAWYEFANTGGVLSGKIPSFAVKGGDLISAEVSYANSVFTVTISNITEGLFYEKSATVPGAQRSSADWVVLKEYLDDVLLPLMDFGKVSSGFDYTSVTDTDWATDSSTTGPISDFSGKVHKITMVSTGGVTEATPSTLTTDGSSFAVNWKAE